MNSLYYHKNKEISNESEHRPCIYREVECTTSLLRIIGVTDCVTILCHPRVIYRHINRLFTYSKIE